jgi:GDP-L-fucose synthase
MRAIRIHKGIIALPAGIHETGTTLKILVTGGNGMLASNIRESSNRVNPDGHEYVFVTRADADLTDAAATQSMLKAHAPDMVIHTAARVGGIAANIARPAEFLMDNLLIDSSLLKGSVNLGIENVIYFGSSCMYPRDYRQPLVEDDVLAAPLEPTNEGYALSKITAAKYCDAVSREFGHNYKVLIPSNLYGPGDDYELGTSHLVASTIKKAHEAKLGKANSIDVWGDGTARREFTFVRDVTDWLVAHVGSSQSWPTFLNIGLGADYSVADFYRQALETVGYECELDFDPSKPAGMHQKLMDSSQARSFGWNPSTDIGEGMALAYQALVAKQP